MPRRENGGAFFLCAERSKDRSLRQLLPEILFIHDMAAYIEAVGAAAGCDLLILRCAKLPDPEASARFSPQPV
jgi:hypothetical protein